MSTSTWDTFLIQSNTKCKMCCLDRNIIIAMILVTIVLVFVICHSPKCIINLLELISIIRGNHLNDTLKNFVATKFSVISYAKYSQNCWTPSWPCTCCNLLRDLPKWELEPKHEHHGGILTLAHHHQQLSQLLYLLLQGINQQLSHLLHILLHGSHQ